MTFGFKVGANNCAGTIIAEVITGKVTHDRAHVLRASSLRNPLLTRAHVAQGALALLKLETGTKYVSEIEGALIFLVLLFVTNIRRRES